jgi:hypothetical protein
MAWELGARALRLLRRARQLRGDQDAPYPGITALVQALQRRSLTWERMRRLEAAWLPPARIRPEKQFDARTRGRHYIR